ncbi:MAG TPA: hypothetical protein VFI31_27525 [Pirellulales bacterium]|nr:hypothetical protein [Pirellulales bacterium]
MPVVPISDPDTFNHAVGVLLTVGGSFETWGVGVLVVNPRQLAALEEAKVVPATKTKPKANGKKKAGSRSKRS